MQSNTTYINNGFIKHFKSFPEAIVFQYIYNWCAQNKKNRNPRSLHFHYFWMFNTCSEIAANVEVLTVDQVKKATLSLEKKGVLRSGSFNKLNIDRTKWYTLTDEGLEVVKMYNEEHFTNLKYKEQTTTSIVPNGTLDSADWHVGSCETARSNQFNKQSNKQSNNSSDEVMKEPEKIESKKETIYYIQNFLPKEEKCLNEVFDFCEKEKGVL